jgi:glucose/arabinose dehydrogenase
MIEKHFGWLSLVAIASVLGSASAQEMAVPPTQEAEVFPRGTPTVDVTARFQLQRLWPARKFDCPVAVALVPGHPTREVVLLQRGEVWLLPEDRLSGEPELILDLRERVKGAMLFEEGCHGLAFHPDFRANGCLYLSYSVADPRKTVLSEFRIASTTPLRMDADSERILMEVPHAMANHFAGGLTFGPDKKLYFAIGDGGIRDDPYRTSQNPLMLLGKMLRLDVDARSGSLPYGIPGNNPFADKQDARAEIFALGLRNPWGFSFDSKTGDLWLADVGQDLWEEVNIVKAGANYGWSDRDGEAGSYFHATPFLPDRTYTDPIFAYTHADGVSITGGFVYHGRKHPRLENCFLCADWGYGTLWALHYDADGGAVTERLILQKRELDKPQVNPTMIAADADGEPLILSQDGAIYTLVEETP